VETSKPSEWKERYSRQVILPAVGEAGQKKWAQTTVGLTGEGIALEAALLALTTSGLSSIHLQTPGNFDAASFKTRYPESDLTLSKSLADSANLSALLILTEDPALRRDLNRSLRLKPRPAFFGWCAGSGFGIFFSRFQSHSPEGPGCPCFECFETLNPKAFNEGSSEARRLLGSLAAAELLQWLVAGESPVENKVWITSLDEGLSFHHPVFPSAKCPAFLIARGAKVTP
jgi:hypothetical protein